MKILYISPLVAGFEDLLSGEMDSKGLPSFVLPLKKMLDVGHQVDIILISDYSDDIDIKVNWISNKNILVNINNDFANTRGIKRNYNRVKSLIELFLIVWKKVKEYDFVYCHGTAALPGNIVANMKKVKCAYRLYGVEDLEYLIKSQGVIKTMLKRFRYFLIFNIKKEFMIITNDGSNGDYVYNQLCFWKKYPLYFWLNGVDIFDDNKSTQVLPENKYIFNAARITKKKGQHNAIEVLKILHEWNLKIHLYIAGHTSEPQYLDELKTHIETFGLREYVHFMGPIKREDMQRMAYDAVATVLLADPVKHSNQGNVFFECLSAGARIITYKEPGLEKFIQSGINGFFAETNIEVAERIRDIEFLFPEQVEQIKNEAINTAKIHLLTWDERAQKERQLIENTQLI